MDYKTFRNVIERAILLDYKEHSETSYLGQYKNVKKESIQTRKEISFLTTSLIFKSIRSKYKDHPFDTEKLTKMLDSYRKDNNLDEKSFTGILVQPEILVNQFAIHYENRKNNILKLLAGKKSHIVRTIPHNELRQNTLNFTYNFKKEFELVEITDKVKESFNLVENFDEVNELIICTKSSPVIINNKEALKTLKEIEENLQSENDDDFLTNGI